MMPWWLIAGIAALWLALPVVGLAWLWRREAKTDRRMRAMEARAERLILTGGNRDRPPNVIGLQRGNPRGVSRRDWPL